MAREFEVKYRSSPQAMARLEADFGPFGTVAMETAYYDAPGRPLSARRWTLRRRLENGRSVCALKTPGQGLLRGEWETEGEDILQAVPRLLALGAPEALRGLTAGGLAQTCAARFTRQLCLVRFGESEIELAMDRGALLGGGKEEPLCEVEAELKRGTQADTLAFGAMLAARYGLVPEARSKLARALALAEAGQEP